jgi:hypothetical protein
MLKALIPEILASEYLLKLELNDESDEFSLLSLLTNGSENILSG